MNEVQVRFQKYKDIHSLSKLVPLDMSLNDACNAIPAMLGLPDQNFYRFGLVKTGKILDEYLTFREAGIEQNDQLILISQEDFSDWENQIKAQLDLSAIKSSSQGKTPELSNGISYKLIIKNSKDLLSWDYSIELQDFYENEPYEFFSKDDQQERKKFGTSLKKFMNREISEGEIEKILRSWCNDINQGYRTTSLNK